MTLNDVAPKTTDYSLQ